MAKTPLSPTAWIDAGLKQLAKQGPSALRAEPLSRHLKTSKGSFYWHFKDVPAFQAALLDTWQERALSALDSKDADDGSSTDRLIRFGQIVQGDKADPAMRAWATADASVARNVAKVDTARMARLETLMADVGLKNTDFVRAAYGALIGLKQTHLDDGDGLVAYAALIDVVMALD